MHIIGVYIIFAGAGISTSFLSQFPYDSYYTSEEKFTSELTAYTRKQFFEVYWQNSYLCISNRKLYNHELSQDELRVLKIESF